MNNGREFKPIVLTEAQQERFWRRVDRNGPMPNLGTIVGPCWIWKGEISSTTGYGDVSLTRRGVRTHYHAHRVSYTLCIGPIPAGAVLDHLCRVRACVCPSHLQPVTQQVNCQRGMTGKAPGTTGERNKQKTHCPRGHEYAGDNLIVRNNRRHCRTCERARLAIYEQTRRRR